MKKPHSIFLFTEMRFGCSQKYCVVTTYVMCNCPNMNERTMLPLLSTCILVCLLLVSGCDHSSEPGGASLANPFLGNWKLMKYDGAPLPNVHYWRFTDTSVNISDGLFGHYTYNPSRFPQTIDLYFVGVEPYPFLSIYRFVRADSLIIKLNVDSLKRPANFNT